jgi:trans-aconitate 2-methyltransferase
MAESPKSREWNASEYHRLSAPQFLWGTRVLSQLHLRGDECVLDAGCGSGKLTRLLLENLPRGRVIALDLSRNMVQHARQNLNAEFGSRVGFVAADLVALPFHSAFDGIFSTASFHWVLDHKTLYRNLYASVKPGGWLHAQCGGGENLKRLRRRVYALSQKREFSQWLAHFSEPWFFSDAQNAVVLLQNAGFQDVETSVEPATFAVDTLQGFKDYLRTFVLHRHLELLPDQEHVERYLQQLATECADDNPPWTLDYWRLNLRARKPE